MLLIYFHDQIFAPHLIDINECEQFANSICHSNERCENKPGTYKCTLEICEKGYEMNQNKTECVGI